MNAELDSLNKSDQTLKIELTINEMNVVMGALQEVAMPHRVIDPVLKKIFNQAQSQLNAPS